MKGRIIIVGFFALVAGLALAFPDRLLNPGPLMQGHAQIEKKCLSCHQPFRGAVATQCTSCHKPEDIGFKSAKGVVLAGKEGRVPFHRGLPENSCIECHTEHKGRDAKRALRTFRHEGIAPDLRANCISCHDAQRPKGILHAGARSNCSVCHTTRAWTPATFDHKTFASGKRCLDCHKDDLPAGRLHAGAGANCTACHTTRAWTPAIFDHKTFASGKRCLDCHKDDLPAGRLHAGAGANCTACHTTRAWTPATFDHNRYFRLDGDHQAGCSTCHNEPSNFRNYTCYGCHEHTASKIDREHLKEGIGNYRNCTRCHRSGTDHD
jgi:hypothetical protein